MTTATVLHIRGHRPETVEPVLEAIFAREGRARRLRLEGTYSAVLRRVTAAELDAGYRYLLLRSHPGSEWTPVMELGNHADGLEVELSRALGGAPVFTTWVYGDAVSGYRLARDGALIDRYASDPLFLAGQHDEEAENVPSAPEVETYKGQPDRFRDLLPSGTAPEDFARVVLRPGWWEARELVGRSGERDADAAVVGETATNDEDKEDGEVDETDRMRCIGLALELWAPAEYPFADEPEELPDRLVGPAIALAFA